MTQKEASELLSRGRAILLETESGACFVKAGIVLLWEKGSRIHLQSDDIEYFLDIVLPEWLWKSDLKIKII